MVNLSMYQMVLGVAAVVGVVVEVVCLHMDAAVGVARRALVVAGEAGEVAESTLVPFGLFSMVETQRVVELNPGLPSLSSETRHSSSSNSMEDGLIQVQHWLPFWIDRVGVESIPQLLLLSVALEKYKAWGSMLYMAQCEAFSTLPRTVLCNIRMAVGSCDSW